MKRFKELYDTRLKFWYIPSGHVYILLAYVPDGRSRVIRAYPHKAQADNARDILNQEAQRIKSGITYASITVKMEN